MYTLPLSLAAPTPSKEETPPQAQDELTVAKATSANISLQITVLCVGNILLMDEGVGPRIAAELNEHYIFPPNVAVLDRGTMGMALLSDIKVSDIILLVDAVDNTGHPAGTVVSFSPEDIAPYEAWHGAHDARFIDVLQAAELLGYSTKAYCLGVQVQNMQPSTHFIGLTEPVEAAVPKVIASVLDFLNHLEVVVQTKTEPIANWDANLGRA